MRIPSVLKKIKAVQKKVCIVVLAAGNSSRMGKPKQLLPVNEKTLLNHTLDQCLESKASLVIVVLGSNFQLISDTITSNHVHILNNARWQQGMGSSISCAMRYVKSNCSELDAVLFALSDQPLVTVKQYNNLINKYITSNKKIVCSRYKEVLGVPAIFDKKYFGDLEKLDGQLGAKELIKKNLNTVDSLNMGECLIDVDTPEDYYRYIKNL